LPLLHLLFLVHLSTHSHDRVDYILPPTFSAKV
jgi:hypothetical protein